MSLKLSQFAIATDPISIENGAVGRLVLSTRTGVAEFVREGDWQSIVKGGVSKSPETNTGLRSAKILVNSEIDELQEVVTANEREASSNSVLEQVVMPTANCQLGCGYCGQEHHPKQMDAASQDSVVKRVLDELSAASLSGKQYHRLSVGWFGGEPLLAMKVVRRLGPALQAASASYGARYDARVVTNGVLLSVPLARELQMEHKVTHVEVTLDGPKEVHDDRRHTKAGGGSFEQIMANLAGIASQEDLTFDLAIRCNVDRTNASSIDRLISILVDHGLHERVKLYFSPVYAWGNEADEFSLDREAYAELEVTWFAQMVQQGFQVDLVPGRKKVVCLAVRSGARVTDAYGVNFNCTEVPYVPAYGSPNGYSVTPVELGVTRRAPFFRDFGDKVLNDPDQPCHSCEMLPVCGGACPKSWSDGKVPCPSFKDNYRDRLALDLARRILESRGAVSPQCD